MHDTATPARTVRVSIPASVAYDIGSLKKSMAGILDKLGCRACCSGFDIFLEHQREGLFGKSLRENATVGFSRALPSDALQIGVSPAAVSSLEDVESLIEKIGGLGGHPACMSGRDWRFSLEELLVVQPETFEVEQVAVRVGL